MKAQKMTARLALATGAALAVGVGAASADPMHPHLAAKLSGMGMHGTVNITTNAMKHELCWKFDAMVDGATGASIRTGAGKSVIALGSSYKAKGCAMVTANTLSAIDAKPGAYKVWLDTKGHPGDLRGMLFAGMTQPGQM